MCSLARRRIFGQVLSTVPGCSFESAVILAEQVQHSLQRHLPPSSTAGRVQMGVQLIRCTSHAGRRASRLQPCYNMRQCLPLLHADRSSLHRPQNTSCAGLHRASKVMHAVLS
jgi:hypothetical protein